MVLVLVVLAAVSVFNRTNGSIAVSGEKREFLLYVPPSYDRTRPTPLVISLHGAMNWPAFQMKISRWNQAADRNGFIVVYPAGTGAGPKTWFMEGSDHPAEMPDVRFISTLIDTLERAYNIDSARIYANGMSNGGGMAFALSCTLSHRIAAIGMVSAAQSLPWTWCRDSTPVPLIEFHGSADPLVPYDGAGTSWLNPQPFPNIRRWVADWAHRNRCAPKPARTVVTDAVRLEYSGCASDASVVLYTVQGAGHQWFGGNPIPPRLVGPMSTRTDATGIMWMFFQSHPLRGR